MFGTASLFKSLGYINTPNFERKLETKAIIEVYPHLAIVTVFNLKERLKYKAKFDKETRIHNLKLYSNLIKSLRNRNPSLYVLDEILDKKLENTKKLKEFEDLLDSLLCAYIARFFWYYPEKCIVFGDENNGYFVAPNLQSRTLLEFNREKQINNF